MKQGSAFILIILFCCTVISAGSAEQTSPHTLMGTTSTAHASDMVVKPSYSMNENRTVTLYDKVTINYSVYLASTGRKVGGSGSNGPITFIVQPGREMKGLDIAIIGMKPGENRTVTIPADQAYGPWLPQMVSTFNKTIVLDKILPQLGSTIIFPSHHEKEPYLSWFLSNATYITYDSNHPLAREDLVFNIQLFEIIAPPNRDCWQPTANVSGIANGSCYNLDGNGSCIPNGADKHTQIIDSHLLGTWYLGDTRLEKGVGGNFQGYLWNSFYILSFDDQGNISGFSGCNCFRGHYTLTGNNQIKIGPLVLTKKSCSNSTDDVIYLQALQNTTRYNVSVNPTNEEYTSMMLINGEAGSSMSYVRTTEPWGTG